MKLTKEQLDSIRNAKTKNDAWEAYEAITDPIFKVYEAIAEPAWEAYENWKPKPDYKNMSKEELIKIIKEKDE